MKRGRDEDETGENGGISEAIQRYSWGSSTSVKGVTDKKLRTSIKKQDKAVRRAAYENARSEVLQQHDAGYIEAEGTEQTRRFAQRDILGAVDENTRTKGFSLELNELGPYRCRYTGNGRHLLLGGRLGHIASADWQNGKLNFELQVRETTRDVTFLHNQTMLAAAQKQHVFVYDDEGTELHCLRNHKEVNRLDFLPFHYLLVSVGNAGYLKYQDTSTGQLVAETKTKLGRCDCMRQNPRNAVMLLGHTNGVVTMWSPTMSTPLVKMAVHKGPVNALAVSTSGNYLVTAGMDRQVSVWDVRTYKSLHSYIMHAPATSIDLSQKDLLGVGFGSHVEVWTDCLSQKSKGPYMSHHFRRGENVCECKFCPFEDVLGVSHSRGFQSLIIPGSGEPNFDAFAANPFESTKQRRETEVRSLVEKLQPEMIGLDDAFIGKVDRAPQEVVAEERRIAKEANDSRRPNKVHKHMRGRDKAAKRAAKKQEKKHLQSRDVRRKDIQQSKPKPASGGEASDSVLDRFKRKDT